jgi:hypothetical protein
MLLRRNAIQLFKNWCKEGPILDIIHQKVKRTKWESHSTKYMKSNQKNTSQYISWSTCIAITSAWSMIRTYLSNKHNLSISFKHTNHREKQIIKSKDTVITNKQVKRSYLYRRKIIHIFFLVTFSFLNFLTRMMCCQLLA